MAKQKRKLTTAERAEKKRRQREYKFIFINGKQKRVKREPTIEGKSVDEFLRANADPVWLLQNGMYEELYAWEMKRDGETTSEEHPNGHGAPTAEPFDMGEPFDEGEDIDDASDSVPF
jgi:hypothetical protein